MSYGHHNLNWRDVLAVIGGTGAATSYSHSKNKGKLEKSLQKALIKKKERIIIKRLKKKKKKSEDSSDDEEKPMKLYSPIIAGENCTFSNYHFKARKVPFRGSKNKYTCSSGTMKADFEYVLSSLIGKTNWHWSVVNTRSAMYNLASLLPEGINNAGTWDDNKRQTDGTFTGGVGAGQNKVTTETKWRSGSNTNVRIGKYTQQFKYQNMNDHPVIVDIYTLTYKSEETTSLSPLTTLASYFPNNEAAGNSYLYLGASGDLKADNALTHEHPDFNLGMCKEFADKFTRKHHHRVRLAAGDEHIHTVHGYCGYTYDPYGRDSGAGPIIIGVSQGVLTRVMGDMVVTNSTALVGADHATIDGTKVACLEVWNHHVWQVDPWRDIFHLNLSTNYKGYGELRSHVGRIEQSLGNAAGID